MERLEGAGWYALQVHFQLYRDGQDIWFAGYPDHHEPVFFFHAGYKAGHQILIGKRKKLCTKFSF